MSYFHLIVLKYLNKFLVYIHRKLYTILQEKYIEKIRSGIMAKNKPVFQSNNSKTANGQVVKGTNKTAAPTPKKPIRGNSRGQ